MSAPGLPPHVLSVDLVDPEPEASSTGALVQVAVCSCGWRAPVASKDPQVAKEAARHHARDIDREHVEREKAARTAVESVARAGGVAVTTAYGEPVAVVRVPRHMLERVATAAAVNGIVRGDHAGPREDTQEGGRVSTRQDAEGDAASSGDGSDGHDVGRTSGEPGPHSLDQASA